MARQSDRWVTPRVVVAGIAAFTVLSLAALAAVTWLTAIGRDPGPMVDTVSQLVTAIGTFGTLGVTLASRAGVAKVERKVGVREEDPTAPLYGRHGHPSRTAPGARGR